MRASRMAASSCFIMSYEYVLAGGSSSVSTAMPSLRFSYRMRTSPIASSSVVAPAIVAHAARAHLGV